MNRMKSRIGVFVCRCGTNIAQTVAVERGVAYAKDLDYVVTADENCFLCSDPGQDLIKHGIQENKLNRVVVASCSPLMHELTFQKACEGAGLNPFFLQMTNIREHCSWVIDDIDDATAKANSMVAAAVKRVRYHQPLASRAVNMNSSVLVVGAGITGIEASLKLADAGKQVYLVE